MIAGTVLALAVVVAIMSGHTAASLTQHSRMMLQRSGSDKRLGSDLNLISRMREVRLRPCLGAMAVAGM